MKKIIIMDLASRTTKVGGEARVVQNLFEGLSKNFKTYYLGFPTSYISAEGDNKIILKRKLPVGAWARRFGLSDINILRTAYNLVFIRRMKHMGLSKPEMEKLRNIAPDVIISNSVADFPLLENLKAQGIEFKAVYIDHGSISTIVETGASSKESIPLTVGSGLSGADIGEIKNKFFSFFDLCVALNKRQYKAMKRFTSRITYIPNGLDVPVRKDRKSLERFRSRYSLPGTVFTILYLGRMFERQKRVSTLIDAFKSVKSRDTCLLLAGEGPSLHDYIMQARGDERIVFTGPLHDHQINDAYEASDVFVLPSAWEGFSLVILEAAAHGIPMILSNDAYIDDLKTGKIGNIPSFDTGNAKALAALMVRLRKNAVLRKKAAASSIAISREFTRKKMLKGYADAINHIS
jgi:glycosyltransferase involved in cell wall biosynthesis